MSETQAPPDRWYAFECHQHPDSPTGVVFDVRVSEAVPALPTARCPLCGAECERAGSWLADDFGYGSRADTLRMLTDEERFAILEDGLTQWTLEHGTPAQILLHFETLLRHHLGAGRGGRT